MIVYLGTNHKAFDIKNVNILDGLLLQKREFLTCQLDAGIAAENGAYVHTFELKPFRTLNLVTFDGTDRLTEICYEFKEKMKIRGNAWDIIADPETYITPQSQQTTNLKYLRWHIMNDAKLAGYDCIMFMGCTGFVDHLSFIPLTSDIINKI